MKPRLRPILVLTLLGVLCLAWVFLRAAHQEKLNDTLIAALKANDSAKALAALKAGADGDAHDNTSDKPPTAVERLKKFLFPHARIASDERYTALFLYLGRTGIDQRMELINGFSRPDAEKNEDDPALVKALLDAGADINDTEALTHWTALHKAARYNLHRTMRLLIARGANIRESDAGEQTLLHDAVRYGDAETVRILLDAGAEVDAMDSDRFTPLNYACMEGHRDAMTLLLQHHANPNLQNIGGTSPLQLAVAHFDKEMVAEILLYHPNVNLRDQHGQTALDFTWPTEDPLPADAVGEMPRREIIALLRKAGAKTSQELSANPR